MLVPRSAGPAASLPAAAAAAAETSASAPAAGRWGSGAPRALVSMLGMVAHARGVLRRPIRGTSRWGVVWLGGWRWKSKASPGSCLGCQFVGSRRWQKAWKKKIAVCDWSSLLEGFRAGTGGCAVTTQKQKSWRERNVFLEHLRARHPFTNISSYYSLSLGQCSVSHL